MKAPGYVKRPSHKVEETPAGERIAVQVGGETIADSADVIRVDENGHPARYYFPRADVQIGNLERSATTTYCPFKGTASYFHLTAGGRRLEDAVWSYEDPYDEHRGLKARVAFYDEKIAGIRYVGSTPPVSS